MIQRARFRVLTAGLTLMMLIAIGVQAFASTGTLFTYQGQLVQSGVPANGDYDFRLFLYDSDAGGSQVGSQVLVNNVPVIDGLFKLDLDFGSNVFTGPARWLEIGVRPAGGGVYTTLSPRQRVTPAPYAIHAGSVSPHTHFGELWSGSATRGLTIQNQQINASATALRGEIATGAAVRGDATGGYGVYGYSANFGVYGVSAATMPGSGYGGYFVANQGIGVYGASSAPSSQSNIFAPGVFGESLASSGTGVMGRTATGIALYGTTSGGFGVLAQSPAIAVSGIGNAPTQGQGKGGLFTSSTGIGVEGRSTAALSGNNLYAPGVFGFSQNGAGVMGQAGGTGSVAGLFQGAVIVDGNLVVTGSKSGYVVDVAINDGAEPLQTGDLVVVTGHGAPAVGEIPLLKVRRADSAGTRAVIGVVDAAYRAPRLGAAADESEDDDGDGMGPGQLLTVVTLGAFKAIKVDASPGAIRVGDLLVASATPGHAVRSDDPRVGTVIGKALGELESGTGIIPVMVSMH
jgi:hypothetical protein